jgi:predicted carbohydrate-binding protein with CBM5 and CBM33 domain
MAPILLLVIILCSTSSLLHHVADAHGYVSSPQSRNWMAAEDVVNAPTAELPNREYCPHCLDVNPPDGLCGQSSYNNFDDWVDSTGAKMN